MIIFIELVDWPDKSVVAKNQVEMDLIFHDATRVSYSIRRKSLQDATVLKDDNL